MALKLKLRKDCIAKCKFEEFPLYYAINFNFNIHIAQFNGFMTSETITTLCTEA